MIENLKKKLEELKKELENLKSLLKLEEKEKRIKELEEKMSQSSFWQKENASQVLEELKDLKNDLDDWHDLRKKLKDLEEIILLEDSNLEGEIKKELKEIEEEFKRLKLKILFREKYDSCSAIVEINSGAGGTEACDWANMLFRMYFRWAQNKGFKVRVLNEVRADEAGIKNITFFVEGRYAYGLLKSERGVHRLVRISPFDANRRRHTSFVSIDVIPQIEKETDFQIKPEELKIETFRASGHGGQHVNVTDSAVRITHLPSGVVVSCQNERSQYQNKQTALKILKAKLVRLREEEKKKELELLSGKKQKIEWGSQIRSYILHPYLLVKDHRTNFENPRAFSVLDGEIDDFIYAYLERKAKC